MYPMDSIYDLSATSNHGEPIDFAAFRGRPMLIVNTAIKCGFTPQYEGLQALHERYGPQGLVVLGFPCDQFGHQEPGNEEEIRSFCSLKYDVTFPMFAKVEVNGENAHPLYRHLKKAAPGLLGTEAVKWNFTKFLVDPAGEKVTRFAPNDTPESLEKDVEKLLKG